MSANPPTTPAEAVDIDVGALVLDHSLQARVEVNEEVVGDYAQLLIDGVELPPIDVIAVDEGGRDPVFLVVDGFHRTLAHRKAQLRVAACRVRPGTRQDALLACLSANSTHGLHRTGKDKARAVRIALEDAGLCKLKGADLAARLAVSKSFVDARRQAYGVRPGKVLDPDHADRVDGIMSKEWKAIAANIQRHEQEDFEKVRLAPSPSKLIAANPRYAGVWMGKAIELRRAELATEEWPFHDQDTPGARLEEMATCDNVEQLLMLAACQATHRAGRLEDIYAAIADAKRLNGKGALAGWELTQIAGRVKRRPALAARVKELAAAVGAAPATKSKYTWASDISAAAAAPERQAELVKEASVDAFELYNVKPWELTPAAFEAFETRFRPKTTTTCRIPGCGGWVIGEELPKSSYLHGICACCGEKFERWAENSAHMLEAARKLLVLPGVGVEISIDGIDITLDREALLFLADVQRAAELGGDERGTAGLFRGAPSASVVAWLHAPPPAALYVELEGEDDDGEEGEEGEDDE